MILPYLYMAMVEGKGRAMFSRRDIAANTVIEIAPVIVMPYHERLLLDKTALHNYIFEWGYKKDMCCMALGYIPIYNHSYSSNCEYEMDYDKDIITVKSVRGIPKGEEITINYNGVWNDTKKIWFDVIE